VEMMDDKWMENKTATTSKIVNKNHYLKRKLKQVPENKHLVVVTG